MYKFMRLWWPAFYLAQNIAVDVNVPSVCKSQSDTRMDVGNSLLQARKSINRRVPYNPKDALFFEMHAHQPKGNQSDVSHISLTDALADRTEWPILIVIATMALSAAILFMYFNSELIEAGRGACAALRSESTSSNPQDDKMQHDVPSTALHAQIFILSVSLFATGMLLHRALSDKPISIPFKIAVGNLLRVVVTIHMWCLHDGSLSDLMTLISSERKLILMYVVPILCFTCNDITFVLALRRISPVVCGMAYNMRLSIAALVAAFLFHERYNRPKVVGFAVMCIGLLGKELSKAKEHAENYDEQNEAYALLFGGVICGLVGTLWNEKLLKDYDIPINAQNSILFSGMALLALIGHVVYAQYHRNIHVLPFGYPSLEQVIYYLALSQFAISGILNTHFLKHLGNSIRLASQAAVVLVSMPMQVLILHDPISSGEAGFVCLAQSGLGCFCWGQILVNEDQEKKKQNEQQEKHDQPE